MCCSNKQRVALLEVSSFRGNVKPTVLLPALQLEIKDPKYPLNTVSNNLGALAKIPSLNKRICNSQGIFHKIAEVIETNWKASLKLSWLLYVFFNIASHLIDEASMAFLKSCHKLPIQGPSKEQRTTSTTHLWGTANSHRHLWKTQPRFRKGPWKMFDKTPFQNNAVHYSNIHGLLSRMMQRSLPAASCAVSKCQELIHSCFQRYSCTGDLTWPAAVYMPLIMILRHFPHGRNDSKVI